jgi:predicted Zn-dependent protease with MMP-like domain
MTRDAFELLVEQAFEGLPPRFAEAIENVAIVVEDIPDAEIMRKMRLRSPLDLLGLYQGVPLTLRGSWYGMTPIPPDKISLYQASIENVCRTDREVVEKAHEVLIHEIAHYFGMNEEEIRDAGY